MLKLKNILGRLKNRINKRLGDQQRRNQKPSLMIILSRIWICVIVLVVGMLEGGMGNVDVYAVSTWERTSSGSYNYTVPATGVYRIEVWGAQGGTSSGGSGGGTIYGGQGGYASGDITLNAGEVLNIRVGGMGNSPDPGQGWSAGGYNGGGRGWANSVFGMNYTAAGGGGATDVRRNGTDLGHRIIVGGGGGGGDNYGNHTGGAGGANTAQDGSPSDGGGKGGDQESGGAAGSSGGYTASSGSLGSGGDGYGGSHSSSSSGGGGGGGYYGGGGGRHGSGGGGSNFINTSLFSNRTNQRGQKTGNGRARITPISIPPTQPGTLSTSGTHQVGQNITVSWGAPSNWGTGSSSNYRLEVSINGGGYNFVADKGTSTSHSYTIPSGTTSVRFRVRAETSHGESDWREQGSIQSVTQLPEPANTIAITSQRLAGQSVDVKWGATPDWGTGDNHRYRVEVRRNGGGWSYVNNPSDTQQTYEIPENTTSLQFRVEARTSDGYSGWIESREVEVNSLGLSLSDVKADEIAVNIDSTFPAGTLYKIERKPQGSSWSVARDWNTSTSFVDIGLDEDTTYEYRVKAKDERYYYLYSGGASRYLRVMPEKHANGRHLLGFEASTLPYPENLYNYFLFEIQEPATGNFRFVNEAIQGSPRQEYYDANTSRVQLGYPGETGDFSRWSIINTGNTDAYGRNEVWLSNVNDSDFNLRTRNVDGTGVESHKGTAALTRWFLIPLTSPWSEIQSETTLLSPTANFSPNSTDWTNRPEVEMSVTDHSGEGINRWRWDHAMDDTWADSWSEWNTTSTSDTITINDQGIRRLRVEVEDNAGNNRIVESGEYKVDNTPPNVDVIVKDGDEKPIEAGAWVDSLSLDINVDAGLSGTGSWKWTADDVNSEDGEWMDWLKTFDGSNKSATKSISTPGKRSFKFWAKDNAGNEKELVLGDLEDESSSYWLRYTHSRVPSVTFGTPTVGEDQTLSWSRVDTAEDGYRVELSRDGGGSWDDYEVTVPQTDSGDVSITIPASEFDSIGTRQFRVRARATDSHKAGAFMETQNRTIEGQTIETTIDGVEFVGQDSSKDEFIAEYNKSQTLQWRREDAASNGYEVQISRNGGRWLNYNLNVPQSSSTNISLGIPASEFLNDGDTLKFRIRFKAVGNILAGPWSESIVARVEKAEDPVSLRFSNMLAQNRRRERPLPVIDVINAIVQDKDLDGEDLADEEDRFYQLFNSSPLTLDEIKGDFSISEGFKSLINNVDSLNDTQILELNRRLFDYKYRDVLRETFDEPIKGRIEGTTQSVFLLSIDELNEYVIENEELLNDETQDRQVYMRRPTQDAIDRLINSPNLPAGLSTNAYWRYWLRTPRADTEQYVRMVSESGRIEDYTAYIGLGGVVPALLLDPGSFMVEEDEEDDTLGKSSDNPYIVTFPD